MEEEADDEFVPVGTLGKRQGFANQAPEALAQGVVEALDGVGGTTLGIGSLVLGRGQDVVVAFQMVSRQRPASVRLGYPDIQEAGR